MTAIFFVAGGVHVGVVGLIAGRDELDLAAVLIPAAAAIAAGALVPFLPWLGSDPRWLTAAGLLGVAFVAATIVVTGGFESPFAPVMAFLVAVQGASHAAPRRRGGARSLLLITALALAALAAIYWLDVGSRALLRLSVEMPVYGAIALASHSHFRRLTRESEERRAIAAIGRAVASSLESRRVYELIADELCRLIHFDRMVVYAGQTDNDELVFERDTYPLADRDGDKALPQLRSGVSLPLGPEGHPAGRLMLFSLAPDAYSNADLELLERVAIQVSPAIVNARLHAEEIRIAVERTHREQLEREKDELQAARRDLERANRDLVAQNALVRESRERLVQAHEAAKRAVAEELHGRVQTRLYAAWVKLGAVQKELARDGNPEAEIIAGVVTELDNIREEDIRLLSHRLHPSVIRLGLGAGLRSLRDYYEHLVPIELSIGEEAAELEPVGASIIPPGTSLGLYRIAELALGNVIKHARATECRMSLELDEGSDRLLLSIADNGVGFNVAADLYGGLGLVTIADYADSLDGVFDLTSYPGEGTRLDVSIPFDPSRRRPRRAAAAGTAINVHHSPPPHSQ